MQNKGVVPVNSEPVFSTEPQERLGALLHKAFDMVPFATDQACDEMFLTLATFCQTTLAKRKLRKEAKFATLDLESLIGLSKSITVDTGGATTERAAATIDVRPKRERASSSAEIKDESRWTFESAYNIVEVIEVKTAPFQLFVKCRPPVAGNQAPRTFCMESSDLSLIDDFQGKKGRRLKTNLANALESFFQDDHDPTELLEHIRSSTWAVDLVKSLESKVVE